VNKSDHIFKSVGNLDHVFKIVDNLILNI